MKYILFILAIGLFSSCQLEDSNYYVQKLKRERYTKDSFFKEAKASPLTNPQKIRFVELPYFEPDSSYRVQADLERISNPDTIRIEDTRGSLRPFLKYAKVHFKLQNKECYLLVFKPVDIEKKKTAEMLFLPFYDASNGKETHEGGRYLDLQDNGKSTITIDFNYAYNPYCAYSDAYSCPIPPLENRLTVKILSGEKEYKED